jgi:hypothetical protein
MADRSVLVQGAYADGRHLDSAGYWHPWWRDLRNVKKDDRNEFLSKVKNDLFDYVSCQTAPSVLILKIRV